MTHERDYLEAVQVANDQHWMHDFIVGHSLSEQHVPLLAHPTSVCNSQSYNYWQVLVRKKKNPPFVTTVAMSKELRLVCTGKRKGKCIEESDVARDEITVNAPPILGDVMAILHDQFTCYIVAKGDFNMYRKENDDVEEVVLERMWESMCRVYEWLRTNFDADEINKLTFLCSENWS